MVVCFKKKKSTNNLKTTTMNDILEILLNRFYHGYKITNFSKDDDSKHLELSLEPIELN